MNDPLTPGAAGGLIATPESLTTTPSENGAPAMFTRIIVAAGSLLIASSALTGTAILRSGAASADPNQDDRFLALLSQNDVPALSGVPSLIATAHQICRNLDAG